MTERILQANLDELGKERVGYLDDQEWSEYGGVEFPTFLVTDDTFLEKSARALGLESEVEAELRKGADTTDAGDTHGQYHNEAEWYRIQRLELQTRVADSVKNGLDRAVIIPSYDTVRGTLEESGLDPSSSLMLGSRARIQYAGDPEDTEDIMLVARLDGGANQGWISVETPLARALQGRTVGESASFSVSKESPPVEVKILEIQ